MNSKPLLLPAWIFAAVGSFSLLGCMYAMATERNHRWPLSLVLAAFAAVFGGFGYGILVYDRWRRGLIQRIRDRGIRIRAEVVGVVSNRAIQINGLSPWRIQAQALIDGKVYRFASENLWYNPSPYLDREQVDVQYLAEDPRKHWMDVSFLPDLAG